MGWSRGCFTTTIRIVYIGFLIIIYIHISKYIIRNLAIKNVPSQKKHPCEKHYFFKGNEIIFNTYFQNGVLIQPPNIGTS